MGKGEVSLNRRAAVADEQQSQKDRVLSRMRENVGE